MTDIDMSDIIHKHLDKIIEDVSKDWKERVEPFIEKTRKSIKHPHFYYAEVDTEKLTVEYKRKKWYQWFSGKRIVDIKLLPIKIPDMPEYSEKNYRFWKIDEKENKDE